MAQIYVPVDSDYALALREPNLLVPGRKPVGPVQIDWANPITRGLSRCYVASAQGLFDAVTGRFVPKVGTVGNAMTPYGVGTYVSGGSDYYDTGYRIPAGAYSYAAFCKLGPLNATKRRFLLGQYNPGSSTGYDLGGPYFSSGFLPTFYPAAGVSVTGANAFSAGEDLRYVAVYNAAASDARLYTQKGKATGSISTAHTGAYNFVIGSEWALADSGTPATIVLVPIWERAITDRESKSLIANPFALLKPANNTPYLFSVGGTALTPPTIGTVTGVSLTPTTARITVPVTFS